MQLSKEMYEENVQQLSKVLEEMANAPREEPLPPNTHR